LEFAHVNQDGNINRVPRNYNGLVTLRRKYVGDSLLRLLKKRGWVQETPESGKVVMLCLLCHRALDQGIPACGGMHK
jgi:hypothetical protein